MDEIVARTDGVPLFVEELTKMVLESGLVQAQEDRLCDCTGPLPPLAIPTTLQDSLGGTPGSTRHSEAPGAAVRDARPGILVPVAAGGVGIRRPDAAAFASPNWFTPSFFTSAARRAKPSTSSSMH